MSRAFLRWQRRLGRPTAIIFLDLTEAFYRVIRPFALGGCLADDDIALIAARLGLSDDTLRQFHHQLQQPSAVQQAGASPVVQRFLQALHTDTWFRVGSDGPLVRTTLGSRPGDSYADVVFGLLWAQLLRKYEALLVQHQVLEEIPVLDFPDLFHETADSVQMTPFLGPTWMDDLAVCLAADSNCALERKTGFALSLLLDLCHDMHMEPNLRKGKTEIMFSFCGSQSRAFRRKYFSEVPAFPVVHENGISQVSVVSRYVHLGGVLHHNTVDRLEVSKRLAVAHQAFTLHRKVLYHNVQIPWDKRKEIFGSLVLSKLLYGLESWALEIQRVKDQFYAGVMRLYKRLLRVPHDQHVTDLDLLTRAGLPLPDEILRCCRLRYYGTLHNCRQAAHWDLLQEDRQWLDLLRHDFQWLWKQISGTTTLGDPALHYPAWKDLLIFHGGFWKKLVKRGVAHAISQRLNYQTALCFHQDIGALLHQYHLVDEVPTALTHSEPVAAYGCMSCGLRFLSRAGEGAHMFKCHRQVAAARALFDETHCPACLREFHTRAKVLAHLRHSTSCRQCLIGQNVRCHVMPGTGSLSDQALADQTDGALPFLQAEGPVAPPVPRRDFDAFSTPVLEALYLCLLDLPVDASLSAHLQLELRKHPISWTLCHGTLVHFCEVFTPDDAEPLDFSWDCIQTCVRNLANPDAWDFLRTDCYRPASHFGGDLPMWEYWYENLVFAPPASWTTFQPLPRSLCRHKLILHAYAGRRRRGDIEWFIEALASQHETFVLQVVSVDIIIDTVYGDITKETTRRFWLAHILDGYVVAFIAGPPCNTWSRARNHVLDNGRGPRVVRTPQEPWGKASLSLRELQQIYIGTLLLGFAFHCMAALAMRSGVGILEHPKEPDGDDLVSIWKLPILRTILELPGMRLISLSQGLFGAQTAKPTSLLVLGLSTLERELHAHRVTVHLPSGSSVGRSACGQFKTAPLKEYPPSMCQAIATALCTDLVSSESDATTLPAELVERCTAMSNQLFGNFIGHDG
eukprot:s55_g17.t2